MEQEVYNFLKLHAPIYVDLLKGKVIRSDGEYYEKYNESR